jgi:hypothetical protein
MVGTKKPDVHHPQNRQISRENASAEQQYPYLTRWIPGLRINIVLTRRFAEAFLEKGQQNNLTQYQTQNSATDWQTLIDKMKDGSFYDYLLHELRQLPGKPALTR